MQSGSPQFDDAIGEGAVVWDDPVLTVDWDLNGFNTIDASDTFDGRTLASSWGNTSTGYTYSNVGAGAPVNASDWSVSGGAGVHSVPAVNAYRYSAINPGQLDVAEQDVIIEWSCPTPTGANLEPANALLHYQDASNHMLLRVAIQPNTDVMVSFFRNTSGGSLQLVRPRKVEGLTYTPAVHWYTRFQALGGVYRIKVWPASIPQPIAWQATASDTTFTSGGWGLRSGVAFGNTNASPVLFTYYSAAFGHSPYDDLSEQVGETFTVRHSLDDGLPDEVTFVSGLGTAELTAPLGYGRDGQSAGRWFSPFNATSPVADYPRDVGTVRLDVAPITANGPEAIRIFTGQLANIPVVGNAATLQAISETRFKLSQLIYPPAVEGRFMGINSNWCITYALAQCGIYLSPPPAEYNCVLWVPFHGSAKQIIGGVQLGATLVDDGSGEPIRPTFVDGPYRQGIYAMSGASTWEAVEDTDLRFYDETRLLTQANAHGRVQFFVRGDAASGSNSKAAGLTALVKFMIKPSNPVAGTPYVAVGINLLRQLFVETHDGFTMTLNAHPTTILPTDGQWHSVGFAWDFPTSRIWINIDGAISVATVAARSTARLPTTYMAFAYPASEHYFRALLPVSDLYVADEDGTTDWNDANFQPQATVYATPFEMEALVETQPREAWEFIGSFALAQFAMMRTDESDRLLYLAPEYFDLPAQQVIVDTLSTEINADEIAVNYDFSKIRNSVAVTYTAVYPETTGSELFSLQSGVETIQPGTTERVYPLSKAGLSILLGDLDTNTAPAGAVPAISTITANTSISGSGSYANIGQVRATITEWKPGRVTIVFTNTTGTTYYLANNAGWPGLIVTGRGATVSTGTATGRNEASVALRRERALPITLRAIQRYADARQAAFVLADMLAEPVAQIAGLPVLSDPRRQPGDLVAIADAETTAASGSWRLYSVEHTKQGSLYTQKVTLRRVS